MTVRDAWALAGFLVACFLAALVGGRATVASVGSWYPTLVKPAWGPPSWLFGPVWTLLYAMMAVAAWLLSSGRAKDVPDAVATIRRTRPGIVLSPSHLQALETFAAR